MRRVAMAVALALALNAACAVTAPSALAPASPAALPSATAASLPKPIPQPITRTSAAAQVAWLRVRLAGAGDLLVGTDPRGKTVATLSLTKLGATGVARSADGATLFLFAEDRIDTRSAVDGAPVRTYRAGGPHLIASAFSADGRWAALLVPGPGLALLDLSTGLSQTLAIGHDPNAKLPGLSGNTAGAIWGTLAFADDSTRVYTLTDWGGPLRVTAFELAGDRWMKTAQAVDGLGAQLPSCAGPAMAVKIVRAGRTLAAFCHVDGAVWLFDLPALTSATVLHPRQDNPFWLSPIFTPDGQLLYLHQWPAFGDQMQVVDLAARRVLGPVPTPTKPGVPAPFSWLAPVAYAGGTASTVPVSPDGLRLYSAAGDGIVVMRIPDLAPIAKLAGGNGADEVWISGDGRTVYATSGAHLLIADDDGTGTLTVDLPSQNASFIASERG